MTWVNRVLNLDAELRRHPFISLIPRAICQELLTEPFQLPPAKNLPQPQERCEFHAGPSLHEWNLIAR
jgi:hypothetical protein